MNTIKLFFDKSKSRYHMKPLISLVVPVIYPLYKGGAHAFLPLSGSVISAGFQYDKIES